MRVAPFDPPKYLTGVLMIRYHDLKRECGQKALSANCAGALTLHWQMPAGLWHSAAAEDFVEADRLARSVLSPPTPYSPAQVWVSPLAVAPTGGWPS